MVKIQTTETTCDVCGYGGPWTRGTDFTTGTSPAGRTLDLCRWCGTTEPLPRWMEQGGHRIEATGDARGWVCSCGTTYDEARPRGYGSIFVASLAQPLHAVANMHLNGQGADR